MKRVILKYPTEKGTSKFKKFNVACTTKGTVLRTYIGHNLSQFRDEKYFLVLQSVNGTMSFLDEEIPLDEVSTSRKIRLQLIRKKCEILAFIPPNNNKTKCTIDLEQNVQENIYEILDGIVSNDYICVFTPKNEIPHLCANSMPLIFQGWTMDDPLYIIRRYFPSDLLDESEVNVEQIFDQCNSALSLNISFFGIPEWASIACLKCIAEGNDIKKLPSNNLIYNYIPDYLHTNSTLVSNINNTKHQYYNVISKYQAMMAFNNIYLNNGISFAYLEKVKFRQFEANGKKRTLPSFRFIYISTEKISISKDFGENFLFQEPINSIQDVSFNGKSISILFESREKWKIKSASSLDILLSIINEIRYNSYQNGIEENQINENHSGNLQLLSRARTIPIFLIKKDSSENLEVEKEVEDIFEPGISRIICPTKKEGKKRFSPEKELYRDLQIIEELEIPYDYNMKPHFNDIPDFNWLLYTDCFFSISHKSVQILVLFIFAFIFSVYYVHHI